MGKRKSTDNTTKSKKQKTETKIVEEHVTAIQSIENGLEKFKFPEVKLLTPFIKHFTIVKEDRPELIMQTMNIVGNLIKKQRALIDEEAVKLQDKLDKHDEHKQEIYDKVQNIEAEQEALKAQEENLKKIRDEANDVSSKADEEFEAEKDLVDAANENCKQKIDQKNEFAEILSHVSDMLIVSEKKDYTKQQKSKLERQMKMLLTTEQYKEDKVFTDAFNSSLTRCDQIDRTPFEQETCLKFCARLEEEIETLDLAIKKETRSTVEQERLQEIQNIRQEELNEAEKKCKEHSKCVKEKEKEMNELLKELKDYDGTKPAKEADVEAHISYTEEFVEQMEKSFDYLNQRTNIVPSPEAHIEEMETGEGETTEKMEEVVIEKVEEEELKEAVQEEEEEVDVPVTTTEPIEEPMEISEEHEEQYEAPRHEVVTEIEQRQSIDHDEGGKTTPVEMEVEHHGEPQMTPEQLLYYQQQQHYQQQQQQYQQQYGYQGGDYQQY